MLYDPVFAGSGIYSGGEIGKNAPFYSPIKGYKINLAGGGGGRAQAIIQGAYYVGRYFRKNPRFGARIGAVAGGLAVERYYNATSSTRRKTFQSKINLYSSRKRNFKQRDSHCCCCAKRSNSRKRRMHY